MTRFSFSTLRFRLILLVFLAVIPALGLTLYSGLEERRHALFQALADALEMAKNASRTQERMIEGAHQILIALSQMPQVHQRDSTACSTIFNNLLKQSKGYTGLIATKPNGDVFASARPIMQPINLAYRAWFQRVLQTRDFVIGEYQIGRISGKAQLVLAYPVLDDSGQLKAILSPGLDLDWLRELMTKTNLPAGTSLCVVDRKGMILFRDPEPEKLVGKPMPEVFIVKTILAKGEGVVEAPGLDGVPRLFGFTSFGHDSGAIYVSIGIPKKAAFAEANRNLVRNLTWLGLMGALALAAAWFAGDLFIMRPINRLLSVTKRLADGDLTVHTGSPYAMGEIGQLAYSFDHMALSLEHREAGRKRAEEALLTEKQRFQTLSENAPFGMVMVDKEGNFKYINAKFTELFGYNLQDVPNGKEWFRKAYPDPTYRHYVISTWIKDLESSNPGGRRPRTFIVTCKGGAEKIINFIPVQLETGENLMTCDDITEHKRAEDALITSQRKYLDLYENANDMIFTFDLLGNITSANRVAYTSLGYSAEEFSGKNISDVLSPESLKFAIELFQRAMTEKSDLTEIQPWEFEGNKKDYTRLFLEVRARLIWEDNKIIGVQGIARDITERKQAENALRTEKQRFQTLLENAPFGMVMIDKDGTFKYVNAKFIELFGYDLNDVPNGKEWFSKAYPDPTYRHHVISTWMNDLRIFEPGEKIPRIFTGTCKDGTEKIIRFITVQLETGENLMSAEDISLLRRAEEEKAALEEQLRQSQRMEAIGRLAGGIAHDFNNLLTVIRGYSQLSLLELKENDTLRGNIEEVQKATHRATDLTRQLLAFSRRQIMDMKVLDLNDLLEDLDKMLRRVIGEDIELVTFLAEDLGRVKTDPGQIEQVILNLAVNARDAMPDGGKLIIETRNVELDGRYARTHVAVNPVDM